MVYPITIILTITLTSPPPPPLRRQHTLHPAEHVRGDANRSHRYRRLPVQPALPASAAVQRPRERPHQRLHHVGSGAALLWGHLLHRLLRLRHAGRHLLRQLFVLFLQYTQVRGWYFLYHPGQDEVVRHDDSLPVSSTSFC